MQKIEQKKLEASKEPFKMKKFANVQSKLAQDMKSWNEKEEVKPVITGTEEKRRRHASTGSGARD
jgi:hypothetical protein